MRLQGTGFLLLVCDFCGRIGVIKEKPALALLAGGPVGRVHRGGLRTEGEGGLRGLRAEEGLRAYVLYNT